MKVVRIGPIGNGKIYTQCTTEEGQGENCNNEFNQQVLSGVRFAPLLKHPIMPTIIPARGWAPNRHRYFPDTFQKATTELLMCSNSAFAQPLPKPKMPVEGANAAAMLPRVMWTEILSFTHRKCASTSSTQAEASYLFSCFYSPIFLFVEF